MNSTVFIKLEFWLLVFFSLVAPVVIYAALLAMRAISRKTVLVLGLLLVLIAGLDVYLLQELASQSKLTLSLADDAVFLSQVTVGLYLLPALFAGVGINLVSHVLIEHLRDAERRFDRAHRDS